MTANKDKIESLEKDRARDSSRWHAKTVMTISKLVESMNTNGNA